MGLMGGCIGATKMQSAPSEMVWGAGWGGRLTCAIWGDLRAIWSLQVPRKLAALRRSSAHKQLSWAVQAEPSECKSDAGGAYLEAISTDPPRPYCQWVGKGWQLTDRKRLVAAR